MKKERTNVGNLQASAIANGNIITTIVGLLEREILKIASDVLICTTISKPGVPC